MFSYRFDMLMLKIFFKKKNLFWYISKQKTLWTVTATTISNTPNKAYFET